MRGNIEIQKRPRSGFCFIPCYLLCTLVEVCSFSGISFQSKTLIEQPLTSPNYPSNYPPLTKCLWSLKRPSTSYVVRLTFKSFYLESSPRCTQDYVEIRDGDRFSTSTLIGKFCGSRLPPIIVSRYTFIFLTFASDSDYYPLKRNFHATFRAIVPDVSWKGTCSVNSQFLHNNNLQLSSSSGGTFRSPSYPAYYPNNMVCTWKISAPSGKRLKLSFIYFILESGDCSTNDYVEVRDGPSSTSIRKGTYCGTYAPTMTSSGRYLWVRFRSDSQFGYKGFEARYTVVSTGSSRVGITAGVVVAVVVVLAIIFIAIYFVKRKSKRIVTSHDVSATTAVTITQPPPAGYVQPIPHQYPVTQPGPPPGVQYPSQQPGNCVPIAGPGMPINAVNGAYPPSTWVMPATHVPPPYYPSEGVKPSHPVVST